MLRYLFNTISGTFMVVLAMILSVNYPARLFQDFPFEPKSMPTLDYNSVIPQWNSKLTSKNPEYIQLNNILGPESTAIDPKSGLIYTGLADGRIVELDPKNKYKLRQVLRFKDDPNCKDNVALQQELCGRFLQMRFVNGTLYAVEAGTGLYKINTKSGTKTALGPEKLTQLYLYNSFAFDPKEPNLVYLTVSSTRWSLKMITWSFLESDSSGQLIALDINTGKRVVIAEELMMANGIDVDVKRDRLVFAELTVSRVSSIELNKVRQAFRNAKNGDHLNVEKKALIPILPGSPDNIIIEGDLAYIALPFVKVNGTELLDHTSSLPNLKKFYARVVFGFGTLLEYVHDNLVQHPLLKSVYQELKYGHINYRFSFNEKSAVVEYNLATGASRFLGTDHFSFLSEAVPCGNGHLLLGSFRSPFLVKVKIA